MPVNSTAARSRRHATLPPAATRGFAASAWMTFRQALELGANVRKGETGSMVVCANRIKKTETDGNGEAPRPAIRA
ncbi:hypothetical protein AM571_PC00041 (plasmid) [Rhizobium etli 8C-3]|uniref:N-terminal domain-containing protein n=1 Tax=Rhizobium etli 8C-3 TaxID=538025 RepID=A0A1L5PC98_RHIET|nr:hypothetical protein AM571_PC00041 [Rhizobium etli 8C-3]